MFNAWLAPRDIKFCGARSGAGVKGRGGNGMGSAVGQPVAQIKSQVFN